MVSKMASCELFFRILITWLLFLFILPSQVTAYPNIDGIESSFPYNPENVNLTVFYETLSTNCSNFIVRNLEDIFNNDLISIINLRQVPWGDTSINLTMPLFHGPDECLLNEVEVCAINVLNDLNKYHDFIYCIEFLAIEGRHKDWQTCFNTLGLPKNPVLDCYNSGNGTKLALQYGYETAHLIPPHTSLPWVIINNQPIRHDYERFTNYVCKAYKGKTVPGACKSPSPAMKSAQTVNLVNPTGHVSKSKKSTYSTPAKRMPRLSKILRKHLPFCFVNLANPLLYKKN